MTDVRPEQCSATVPEHARNPEGRKILAGNRCELDAGHEGHHWTRQVYFVGGDPERVDEVSSLAEYEWDD